MCEKGDRKVKMSNRFKQTSRTKFNRQNMKIRNGKRRIFQRRVAILITEMKRVLQISKGQVQLTINFLIEIQRDESRFEGK